MAKRILDRVDSPEDLKRLSYKELERLAKELRGHIIERVLQNGGHLASNLGAVELSLAVHRVFDSPRDKIVWDVGHQSYTHKLVTGRKERFHTLRQLGGLSGFTERSESEHDPFGAGHASTSISAALGIATARDLAGDDYHVVCVVGDGALTGGMALEALNQAGHLGTRLIVVLNDNNMSISPNVGALSRSFNRLRLDRRYHRAKEELEEMLERVPLGERVLEAGRRFKKGFKGLIIPVLMWEELGFTYMGPIDGHNLVELEAALRQAKSYPSKPTFVHVLTTKGKGYHPAEDDAVSFHGVPPNGGSQKKAPTYTQVFAQTLLDLARQEPRLVAITAAMRDSAGLTPMSEEFPNRVFDVGICEQHGVTFAAGLASQGFIPVVAIYSTFLQRAYDQVVHDVCAQNLPVVFVLDRGGIVGDDGKTHQGAFDLSYLSHIPNMTLASPKDEEELRHLVATAVRAGRPMAVRYPRGVGVGVPLTSTHRQLPIGRGELLREGDDVALVAVGAAVYPALEAAGKLAAVGIRAAVVNARYVKPLDENLLKQVAKATGRMVTIEENALQGGFGSAVAAWLQDSGLNEVRLKRLGITDSFVEHGTQAQLRAALSLDAKGIEKTVLQAFPELRQRRPMAALKS